MQVQVHFALKRWVTDYHSEVLFGMECQSRENREKRGPMVINKYQKSNTRN